MKILRATLFSCFFVFSSCTHAPLMTTGGCVQDAYLWQRDWNSGVKSALANEGGDFHEIIALAAEVSWTGEKARVLKVPLDYPLLRELPGVGLALRVGAYSGNLAADSGPAPLLASLAESITQQASSNGIRLRELQLDFDCPSRKLAQYEILATKIRSAIAPVPFTITALPSWLRQSAFPKLAAATDGYVLQVHSWSRPSDFRHPFALCDPSAARAAVKRAARLGIPLRVALPTYGYIAAFTPEGRIVGLSAEGPSPRWPPKFELCEITADPDAIAALVSEWLRERPALLTGIIWFRLPVPADQLNWPWPALKAVMSGRAPKTLAVAAAKTDAAKPGLSEIVLRNAGETSIRDLRLTLSWDARKAQLLSADALAGFDWIDNHNGQVTLQSKPTGVHLRPGETRVIGWVRLNASAEVHCEIRR